MQAVIETKFSLRHRRKGDVFYRDQAPYQEPYHTQSQPFGQPDYEVQPYQARPKGWGCHPTQRSPEHFSVLALFRCPNGFFFWGL